jgi:DNA-binding Lrp family transcriptional regulator
MGYPNEPGAVGGSATSEHAAMLIAPSMRAMHQRIIEALTAKSTWGATSKEAGDILKMKPQTVSARFAELRASGQIKRTMSKRTTQGQYKAYVYISAAVARAFPEIELENIDPKPTSDKDLRDQIQVIQYAVSLLDARMDEYIWTDRLHVLSKRIAKEAKKLEKML